MNYLNDSHGISSHTDVIKIVDRTGQALVQTFDN